MERVRVAAGADWPALVCERVMQAAIEDHIPKEGDIALIALRRHRS